MSSQGIHDRKVSEEGEWLYKHLHHKMVHRKAKLLYLFLQEDHFSLDQVVRSHNSHKVVIHSWNHARIQINREDQPITVKIIHNKFSELGVLEMKAPSSND